MLGTAGSGSSDLLDGDEGGEFLARLMERRSLGKLAKLWVDGARVAWDALWPQPFRASGCRPTRGSAAGSGCPSTTPLSRRPRRSRSSPAWRASTASRELHGHRPPRCSRPCATPRMPSAPTCATCDCSPRSPATRGRSASSSSAPLTAPASRSAAPRASPPLVRGELIDEAGDVPTADLDALRERCTDHRDAGRRVRGAARRRHRTRRRIARTHRGARRRRRTVRSCRCERRARRSRAGRCRFAGPGRPRRR